MTEEEQKAFIEEYNALCQKHGCKIVANPSFVPTNHGSYELTISMQLVKTKTEKPSL
jgi:hypothetical protein